MTIAKERQAQAKAVLQVYAMQWLFQLRLLLQQGELTVVTHTVYSKKGTGSKGSETMNFTYKMPLYVTAVCDGLLRQGSGSGTLVYGWVLKVQWKEAVKQAR